MRSLINRRTKWTKNTRPKPAAKEQYKVNGHTFTDYGQACEYIRANNFRVTTTEKLGDVHLLNVVQVN